MYENYKIIHFDILCIYLYTYLVKTMDALI